MRDTKIGMLSRWKKFSLDFQQYNHFKYQKIRFCARFLVLEWTERAFIEQVNSRCFCWFPAAMLISGSHIRGPKWWTNMASPYKALQRWVKPFYILVFYNIPVASSAGRFPIYFFVAWQWKRCISLKYFSHLGLFNLLYKPRGNTLKLHTRRMVQP